MILNNAADIKIGSTDVDRVYLGTVVVWERSGESYPDHVIMPFGSWIQGGLGTWGNEYDADNRLRADGYFPIGDFTGVRVLIHDVTDSASSYLEWAIQGYIYDEDDNKYESSPDFEGSWIPNSVSEDESYSYRFSSLLGFGATHFRIMLHYHDNSKIRANHFNYGEFFMS